MILNVKPMEVDENIMEAFGIKQLNELRSKDGLEPLIIESLGFIINVIDDNNDDNDWEIQEVKDYEKEVRDFVKCHPMPSSDNEEGKRFWKKISDRLNDDERVNGKAKADFIRLDIIKRMYENITDKIMIIKWGKDLHRHGKYLAMAINPSLLSITMDELNNTKKHCLTPVQMIEDLWDGIGRWRA